MTPRERVITALEHKEPDRVPIEMEPTIGFYNNLKKYLGVRVDEKPKIGVWTEVFCDADMLTRLGLDIIRVQPDPPKNWKSEIFPDGSFTDEWGTVRKKTYYGEKGGYYYEMVKYPLENAMIDDLDKFNWPDPEDESRVIRLGERARELSETTDFAIMAMSFGSLFETAQYLRGQEKWLMDLILNPEFARALLDKLCSIELKMDKLILEAVGKYAQIFHIGGEDSGTQDSLLFSPEVYRKIIKPYHKRRWMAARETFRKHNPQGKIMVHSCGAVYPLIEDFIDCGIDALDPIQPLAKGMESKKLKEEFGDRLSFCGAIDIQRILPFGTVEEVEGEVKNKISDLASNGGYILRPAHYVPGNVPPENLMAMIEAAKKYGQYPIKT